jgi:squalene monooxygenase
MIIDQKVDMSVCDTRTASSPSKRLIDVFITSQLAENHGADQPDIIVIGAGIAGCALAYSLSHAGHHVLLVERDLSPPDRIVGELLQPGGVAALRHLGMGECLEGIDATPVEGYCVYMQGREVPIPYPTLEALAGQGQDTTSEEKEWSRSGKKEGRSFHHGRFINALRQKVIKDAPKVTVLEGTVKNLITCDLTTKVIGVSVKEKSTDSSEPVTRSYYAPLTIVADGCMSNFRKAVTTPAPNSSSKRVKKVDSPVAAIKTKSSFVGLVIQGVRLPKANHGTVCLTPEGPVLLYQIADKADETRLLVDVKGKLPSIADGSLKVSRTAAVLVFDEHITEQPRSLVSYRTQIPSSSTSSNPHRDSTCS